MKPFVALVVGLLAAMPAVADIAPETRWNDAGMIQLDVGFPGNDYHARWVFHHCECGDVLIEAEQNSGGSVERGQLLLVDGQLMLVSGFADSLVADAAQMDAPSLMMQVYMGLLQLSAPNGPSAVTAVMPLQHLEISRPLAIDTGFAQGSFGAPWEVNGEVQPVTADRRRVDFSFRFTLPDQNPPQQATMQFVAVMDFAADTFPLAADADMSGWRVSWLGPEEAAPADGEVPLARLSEARAWQQQRRNAAE